MNDDDDDDRDDNDDQWIMHACIELDWLRSSMRCDDKLVESSLLYNFV